MVKKKTTKKTVKKSAPKNVSKKITKKQLISPASGKSAKKKITKKKTRSLVIEFNDPKRLANHVQANIQKKQQEEVNQIIDSLNFWDWLKKQKKLNLDTFKVDLNNPLYRVYPSQFTVTSITGSISDGARLNIGANQVLKDFFSFNKFGAVYYATTMECAIEEYAQGTPLNSNDIRYTLQPTKSFELWDLDKIIQTLSHPSLDLLISKLPIGGGWANCKVPMPSQILAYWLKSTGGDGILYTSTKEPSSKIVALFAKDDAESSSFVTILTKKNT